MEIIRIFMEKILVTGSSGFIGMHLCKSLLEDDYEVFGVDNMNNYYDPQLKEARLGQLSSYSNFNFIKADVLLVRASVILTGCPSSDLANASSGGGTNSREVSTTFDIITFPELSNK